MSGCAECRELISAYLDGEASPDEAAHMRGHLATCAECRATMETYRRIGMAVRSMPTVLPPSDLTASIYAQTIDTAPRRLFLITGRMRYPLAAAAAILLIFFVAAYMLFSGYQRSIQPEIANYEPGQNVQWQTQKPIKITFNKAMDRESVEAALAIQPPEENERLDKTWDGNTLLIGGRPLRPGSEYTIKITTDARDEWGNRLAENFELSFQTVESVAFETPTPIVPTPTATAIDDIATATVEPSPSSTSAAVIETVPPSGGETPVVAPTATATSTRNDSGDGGGGASITPTPTRLAPVAPTTWSEPNEPTSTPTPSPTPSPTATVPAPTVTAIPPTATAVPATATVPPSPTPTATQEPEVPTPSPTVSTVPAVTGVFGDVYWSNQSVQARLGEPLDMADTTNGQALGFQNGTMLYRSDFDSIYVLVSGESSWDRRDNPGQPYPAFVQVTESTWSPGGIFGALWQSELYYQDTLKLAVSDSASEFIASVQSFENGTMFSAPGVVYIFYESDGTWEFWPASE